VVRLYDPDGNRVDDGPPAPEDRWVIERLERCGGVFDYDDRLTVRVGRRDDRYAYAVAERETLADAADALRRWRDEDPEIEVGQFVDLLDTDEGSGETDADEGSDETDGDTTDATNSRHPVPTRVRLLNGSTATPGGVTSTTVPRRHRRRGVTRRRQRRTTAATSGCSRTPRRARSGVTSTSAGAVQNRCSRTCPSTTPPRSRFSPTAPER
jgi:hypothetical protein